MPSSPTSSSSETTRTDSDASALGLRRSGAFESGSRSDETEEADPTILQARGFPAASRADAVLERYESRSVLGEGGMGEVRLVWDRTVGREVAMKVLLPARMDRPRAQERFLREAHVQGLLDHPSIVPVHDLGTLPTGEPYFTMKRVRGVTLHEVLEGWRRKDARLTSRFGRRRMLAAFAQACLAVDYAHARGVVHRDLKPENLMLGDFGEVYVLDWGVARLLGTQVQRMPTALLGAITRGDGADVLGTPGYMAPEQVDTPEDVDASADVYALGAILFELLALEPLHRGRSVRELMTSTREGADARCSVRAPAAAVPLELEALCARATHLDPLKRPQARELHEAIESFLDGDRESQRRRLVSELHLRAAKETWRRAMQGGPHAASAQRDAIRGLARSLSADPGNPQALESLLAVLQQPVEGLPEEAAKAMHEEEERHRRVASKAQRWGRVSWLAYVPLVLWLGVRDWTACGVALGAIVTAALASAFVDSLPSPRPWMHTSVAVLAMLTMMPIATLFSPIVLLPVLLAASVPAFIVHLDRAGRIITTLAACIAAGAPLVLESVGALPATVAFHEGAITILPRMTSFPELPTRIVLTVFAMSPLITAALLMERVRSELDAARRRVHLHLWRLRQLMPTQRDR